MIAAVVSRRPVGRPLGSKDRRGRAQRVNWRVLGSSMWRALCTAAGHRLRAMREERNISAAELAAAIGAAAVTVLAWERGRSMPSLPTMVMLAAALRCSIVDLLPDEAHHNMEAA